MLKPICLLLLATLSRGTLAQPVPVPDHVDITWMSVTNMYYEIGTRGVVTDGYISRIPPGVFFGASGGLAQSHTPQKPDIAAVRRVLDALGGPSKVQLLLSGHSHFDHSFDTAVWSALTNAPIMGSRTTCYQAFAQGIPRDRCTTLNGGERIQISDGVAMYVVRWNHSGDPAINPEQHNPAELSAIPRLDSVTGGLRPGVAEDFPNGGGSRAYLFVVDAPNGRFSWFFQNSASVVDLEKPIVVDGVSYGAPLENLKSAMQSAGLTSVDLWIGTGGVPLGNVVVPVLHPKAFIPVHWDSFYAPFESGVTKPYADPPFEAFLGLAGTQLLRPAQYMDKWRLSAGRVVAVDNAVVKTRLGFKP